MSALAAQETGRAKAMPSLVPEQRCFTILVNGEMFGLPVQIVQTIFRIHEITPVPLGPPEVEGLVNLRGRIVTAISLKSRLFRAARESARGALAIGIQHKGENFALIVDEVGDVITCEESARLARPSHVDPDRARLIREYHRLEASILPILDMDSVLDFAERNRGIAAAHLNTRS